MALLDRRVSLVLLAPWGPLVLLEQPEAGLPGLRDLLVHRDSRVFLERLVRKGPSVSSDRPGHRGRLVGWEYRERPVSRERPVLPGLPESE